MGGASGLYGQEAKWTQWFGGATWRKGPPGISRHKLVDNVNKDLKNRMWGCGMDSSGSNMTNDGLPWTQFHKTNVKVKISMSTPRRYKEGVEAFHTFWTSALVQGRESTSCPQFFTPGEEIWYPLKKRLDKSQSQSGHYGEQKNLLPLPGLEPQIIQTVAESLYWQH